MKKNVFLILFSLLPVLGFAQGNCHVVDDVCQRARQFAEIGDYDEALKGLNRAQNDNELRSCPGSYKIAELINEIENTIQTQKKCDTVDEICQLAQQFITSGDYDKALKGLNRAKNDEDLRSCPGFNQIVELMKEIENRSKTSVTKNGSIWTYTVNGVSFNMVQVDGGTFTMGATAEQEKPGDSEKPAHQVTLSSYMIGETEVTQELWQAVMGSNPSNVKGAKHPVEHVSWNDCQEFIKKLNQKTGARFRLPTEAEWEFAARGGNRSKKTQYAGGSNLGSVAWFGGNSGGTTHDVATKSPNELGLYDMSGNVWEWCQDWKGSYNSSAQTNPTGPSSGSYRVLRGGSWLNKAWGCRVSGRYDYNPLNRDILHGLRLAF